MECKDLNQLEKSGSIRTTKNNNRLIGLKIKVY